MRVRFWYHLAMSTTPCPPEFTRDIRATIISALQTAYAEADALYAPERGVGDRVHAIAVYDVVCMLFERDLAAQPNVTFVSHGRGPELRIGDLRVRWNKVGRGTEGNGIQSSFPRGSRAAVFMAIENKQMTIWSDDGSSENAQLTNWIAAHLGNPRDGLRAVYLAAPIEVDGERVTGWHTVVPIWSADDPTAEFPVAPTVGLPEPAPLPELEIGLIDDEATGHGAG
jgi:hypothetical protein